MCHGMCVEVMEKPWVSSSSPFLKKIYFELHMYICMSVCGYMPVSAVSAEFRRGVGPLELELQAIVSPLTWVLGTKLWKSNMLLLTTESSSSCSLCIWGKISLVVCHCAV